jgi:hypothetical protein
VSYGRKFRLVTTCDAATADSGTRIDAAVLLEAATVEDGTYDARFSGAAEAPLNPEAVAETS